VLVAISVLLGVSANPADDESGSHRDAVRVLLHLGKGVGEFLV